MPEAYKLPTTAPALVPVTMLTGMLFSRSTLITPMWAKPLLAPPPKAKPTTALGLVCTTWVGDLGESVVPQAAKVKAMAALRKILDFMFALCIQSKGYWGLDG